MKHMIFIAAISVCICFLSGLKIGNATTAPQPESMQHDEKTKVDPCWFSKAKRDIIENEYNVNVSDKGVVAPNRAHNLRIRFDETGIHIMDRTTDKGQELLGLSAIGLGRTKAALNQLPKGTIRQGNNCVEIERSGITEWYLNSPNGLEQGFTITERPKGNGDLRVDISVTQAEAVLSGDSIRFTTPTGRQLQYGAFKAYDSKGSILRSYMTVTSPDRISLVVDDSPATYPIVIDPLITAEADEILQGVQSDSEFGWAVASAGDVNGDGYDDIIVGAPDYDNGENDEGAAFIFLGSADGIANTDSSTADHIIESNQDGAKLGYGVASAGDVNNDGYDDVIVSAYMYDDAYISEGAVFVFLGYAGGIVGSEPSAANAAIMGNQLRAYMGKSVASAGDVNGDGYDDVIVGAPLYDNGEYDEGAAFIFLGSASGIEATVPGDAAVIIDSDQAYMSFAPSVASAGDFNRDGYDDVVVGSPNYSNGETSEGGAFLYLGSDSIESGSAGSMTLAGWVESNQTGAWMGYSVASAGDVNGGGYDDIIVGAPNYDNGETDEGAAFIYTGNNTGYLNGGPSDAFAVIESNQDGAYAGWSVASAGDVNNDGYDDVIVGAYVYTNGTTPDEGAAFVFSGNASGLSGTDPSNAYAVIEGNSSYAAFGYSVSSAGDIDGDGYGDVIIGAPDYSFSVGDYQGAAFVFQGNDSTGPDINTSPVADSQSVVVNENSTDNVITLTASDADGDSLTFTITSDPANGTLSGSAPNLLYTPDSDYSGTDAFTFSVHDGIVESSDATVTITIDADSDDDGDGADDSDGENDSDSGDDSDSGGDGNSEDDGDDGDGGGGSGGGGGCFILTVLDIS